MNKITRNKMKIKLKTPLLVLSSMFIFGAAIITTLNSDVLAESSKSDNSLSSSASNAANQKAIDAAKSKIEEFTGNSPSLFVSKKDGSTSILKTNKNKSDEIFVSSKGIVTYVSLTVKYEELGEVKLKEQLDKAWQLTFPEVHEPLEYVRIRLFEGFPVEVRASNSKGMIALKDGKLEYGVQYANEKEIPSAALKAADQVFNNIGKGVRKTDRKLKVIIIRPGEPAVYGFEYNTNKGKISVEIEENSLQPLSVLLWDIVSPYKNKNLSEKEYKAEQKKLNSLNVKTLAKTAQKEAKALMNLDLSGYSAEKYKHSNETLVFTKKGAPEVHAGFTSAGTFGSFTIKKHKVIVLLDKEFIDPIKP
ncbi:hypothetical protein [Paenibacillus sp. TC-CSREp1]|uniref:hypothetical protein n=1 Tax=Paenibacillus sp. TC-CSREp1 TaxID=3410089 RepID=UPI003D05E8C0